jgi:hypothetical protein
MTTINNKTDKKGDLPMIILFMFSILLLIGATYLYITRDDTHAAQTNKKYERIEKLIGGVEVDVHRLRSELKLASDEVTVLRDLLNKQGDKLAWAEMKLNNLPRPQQNVVQKVELIQSAPLKMTVVHRKAKPAVTPTAVPSADKKVIKNIKQQLKQLDN